MLVLASLVLGVCTPSLPYKKLHVPHSIVTSAAAVERPGGNTEILATVSVETPDYLVLRSRDNGLSWDILEGDGLGQASAIEVVFHPEMPADVTPGLFIIGTLEGVWAYHPETERVERYVDGLDPMDDLVLDMDAPRAGSTGPAVMITNKGNVYARFPTDTQWNSLLTVNLAASPDTAAIAVAPHYDPNHAPGPENTILIGLGGVLAFTKDAGVTWNKHQQFKTYADPFRITSIGFAEDFNTSGLVLVGRSQANPEVGEIWRSDDFGGTFGIQLTLDTEISFLTGTPLSPTGKRYFFAVGRKYPWNPPFETGIMRSEDGGLTWDDFGTAQDFVLRGPWDVRPTGSTQKAAERRMLMVPPNFSSFGDLYLCRPEGLYYSEDEGLHWQVRRVRPEEDLRSLSAAQNSSGENLIFGASYGSTSIRYNDTTSTIDLLYDSNPLAYQRSIAASPQFAADGTVFVGGSINLYAWYDPSVTPLNPFAETGWFDVPVFNETYPTNTGYPRIVRFSPHFDMSGLPGTDQTIFWNVLNSPPFRSEDAGATAAPVGAIAGGGQAPRMSDIQVAPTYDSSSEATKNDVYACAATGGRMYRLQNDEWEPIKDFSASGVAIAIDPNYDRTTPNPRLFIALNEAPYFIEIIDEIGNLQTQQITDGLPDVQITDLVASPDTTGEPVLYLSTLTSGVFKLNLNDVTPMWTEVGNPFPDVWAKSIALSPDFLNDQKIFVGTSHGLFSFIEGVSTDWELHPMNIFRDDQLGTITTYAVNDPLNLQPDRPWYWSATPAESMPPEHNIRGPQILWTDYDLSEIVTLDYAQKVRIFTIAGPGMGEIEITITDFFNDSVLASITQDLDAVSSVQQDHIIELDLGGQHPVRVEVKSHLDAGEILYFDGLEIIR